MKKVLFILLIIAGICYYYNPPIEDHINLLSSQAFHCHIWRLQEGYSY
jgi:hypothetical protein